MRTALASKGRVKGSVEICGKGKSPQIVYEHGLGSHDADGNLIVPRTPVQYHISALAILSDFVPPADDGSQVIEINSMKYSRTQINKKDNNKKEESNMAEINTETVIELNTKVATQAAEINNLQHQVNEKDAELNKCKEELNACKEELNAYKKKEEELNKCKEELNSSKNKETELNSLLVEANKTVESQKTQIAELNSEIEPLRQMKADVDSKTAQAEINAYFETIKKENGFSEAELNSLKADFVDKGDLAGLKAKETELCVNKFKELKKIDAANVEINSANNNSNLFFSTKNNAEVNSVIDDGSELFR